MKVNVLNLSFHGFTVAVVSLNSMVHRRLKEILQCGFYRTIYVQRKAGMLALIPVCD